MNAHGKHAGMVAAVLLGLLAAEAAAAPITIRDNASRARIDPNSDAGMDMWVVSDPTLGDWGILQRQWFWYRTGTMEAEEPLNTLDADPFVLPTDTDGDGDEDNLLLRYTQAGTGLVVEVNYRLMGGGEFSGRADIAETILFQNAGNLTQTVHFFQYSDFVLSLEEDTVWIPWPNTAEQWFDDIRMTETVVTPVPDGHAVNHAILLLNELTDDAATTLAGPSGPLTGDVAWAFQWDMILEPGGSFLVSKDKGVYPAPEPATLALLSLGVAGLVARRRRKG